MMLNEKQNRCMWTRGQYPTPPPKNRFEKAIRSMKKNAQGLLQLRQTDIVLQDVQSS